MERHGVETKEDCDREADEYKWMAWNPEKGDPADEEELGYMIAEAHVCFGQTEDEAVANWACEHKIKLWNEE